MESRIGPVHAKASVRISGIDFENELNRYSAVVHVEVPALACGYEKNRVRRESVSQAREIDHASHERGGGTRE